MIDILKKLNKKGDAFIAKHGINDFHKKAAELLADANLPSRYNFQELVNHSLSGKHTQYFQSLEFSDLPLTLSFGEHCFIDVYFWLRRPTVIHNHHFAGAFMCLQGNNLDLEFIFKKERKLGKFHDLGVLTLKQERNMRPGDIAEIAFMNKFIHQNHHLDELTVNLCFRTPREPNKNLSNYLFSGLRYEKDSVLLGRVARLQRMIDLGVLDHRKANVTIDDAIYFLIQTFETRSQNPRLIRIRKSLDQRVKEEAGIDIDQLLRDHHKQFEEIENNYE